MNGFAQDNAPEADRVPEFRRAMRSLAAGVTIITTAIGTRAFGMTATAVTSLSMSPPSLSIAVNRSASIYPALLERKAFRLNILRDTDAEFCRAFSSASGPDRFEHGAWEEDDNGLPMLLGAQATIACTLGPKLEFGSHAIIVGQVVAVSAAEDVAPLLYLDGAYHKAGPRA